MRRIQSNNLSQNSLDSLAEFVRDTGLKPGDRLPSERELADNLGVSRPIVREALGRWAALGVIETRNGRGTYLKQSVGPGSTHVVFTMAGERQALLQVLEVRQALETEAAALAAARASEEQVDELWRLLEAVEEAYDRVGDAPDEDWAFHQAVYRAAGNPLFLQFIDGVVTLFHRFWENPLHQPDFARRGLPYHRTLVERIAARDPEGAREAVRKIIGITGEDLRRENA
jgi:GntR family transcriptional repressor for pyruvate dehydrogenase complex